MNKLSENKLLNNFIKDLGHSPNQLNNWSEIYDPMSLNTYYRDINSSKKKIYTNLEKNLFYWIRSITTRTNETYNRLYKFPDKVPDYEELINPILKLIDDDYVPNDSSSTRSTPKFSDTFNGAYNTRVNNEKYKYDYDKYDNSSSNYLSVSAKEFAPSYYYNDNTKNNNMYNNMYNMDGKYYNNPSYYTRSSSTNIIPVHPSEKWDEYIDKTTATPSIIINNSNSYSDIPLTKLTDNNIPSSTRNNIHSSMKDPWASQATRELITIHYPSSSGSIPVQLDANMLRIAESLTTLSNARNNYGTISASSITNEILVDYKDISKLDLIALNTLEYIYNKFRFSYRSKSKIMSIISSVRRRFNLEPHNDNNVPLSTLPHINGYNEYF